MHQTTSKILKIFTIPTVTVTNIQITILGLQANSARKVPSAKQQTRCLTDAFIAKFYKNANACLFLAFGYFFGVTSC